LEKIRNESAEKRAQSQENTDYENADKKDTVEISPEAIAALQRTQSDVKPHTAAASKETVKSNKLNQEV